MTTSTISRRARPDRKLPRALLLGGGAALAALGLAVLKPTLDSYYDAVVTGELTAKVGVQPATEYAALRRREDVLLLEKGVPMDRVFAQLARGRQAGPALIAPRPSTDLAPIVGWVGLPSFVHTAHALPVVVPPVVVPPVVAPVVAPVAPPVVAPVAPPASAPAAPPVNP